jgi:hypothetical protein
MPADHLTATSPSELAAAVLAVLAGADLKATAAARSVDPDDLDEALLIYQAAGRAALERHAEQDWYQVRVQFADSRWPDGGSCASTPVGGCACAARIPRPSTACSVS